MNSRRSQEPPPVIDLGEFILRPLRPGDSEAWLGYLRDPRTTEHTSWPEVSSSMMTAIVDRLISEYETRSSLRWALARKDGDELIGTCGFTRIDRANDLAELAYDLAPAYWGNGIMRCAVEAVVNWAFSDAGIRRVEALVMVSTSRSLYSSAAGSYASAFCLTIASRVAFRETSGCTHEAAALIVAGSANEKH